MTTPQTDSALPFKMSLEKSLEIGDIVRLKSGSPLMTVQFIDVFSIGCSWFDETKHSCERFSEKTLKKEESSPKPSLIGAAASSNCGNVDPCKASVAAAMNAEDFECEINWLHDLNADYEDRMKIIDLIKQRDSQLLAASRAREAALVQALRFYQNSWEFTQQANEKTIYASPAPHLLKDCGNIARETLAQHATTGGLE